jgi:Spy/CpxP family protein refolding chaperone
MKTIGKYLGAILLTAVLATSVNTVSAQKHMNNKECAMNQKKMMCKKLNLTAEQEASFKKINTDVNRKILPLKNKLNELKARQRTLMTVDLVNRAAVIDVVEDICSTMKELYIIRTNKTIDLRNLLTEEQKMKFDNRTGKHHKGNRNRRHKR